MTESKRPKKTPEERAAYKADMDRRVQEGLRMFDQVVEKKAEELIDFRKMTDLFLIRAARPKSGTRIDAFVEAETEGAAYELWSVVHGKYDADPDFPHWRDVEIVEVPRMTGEPHVWGGFEFA